MQIKPFQLEEYYAKYEFNTKYMLSSSDCESFTVSELLDFAPNYRDEFEKLSLAYTEAPGGIKLREEIKKLFTSINTNEIIVHAGAEEGIFTFMNSALKAGDHIVVQYPAYQSLYEIAKSIGCEITEWQMSESNDWKPDLNELKTSIKPNTKAIIINTPHNPTGFQFSKADFEKIIEIAKSNDLYLFSDEVYRFLEYDKKDRLPAAADLYEKAVSLGVISKSFGLAGLRIGWIVSKDKELMDKISSFKHYTSICNSAPSEFLTTIALRHKEELIKRNLEIINANHKILDEFFTKHQKYFNYKKPVAGSIAFPSLKGELDSEKFCVDLIQKKGVLLLPSTYYNYGNKNFRIGFSRKNMPEALSKFDEYINEANLGDEMVAEGRFELPTCGL